MRRAAARSWAAIAGILAALLGVAAAGSGLEDPAPTVLLTDRRGEFLGEVGGPEDGELGYWRLGTIPERVAAATLAVEDRRFFSHPGVDPLAVARAAWQNLRSRRRTSGASTIAMQVARMQRPGPRTLVRKAVEALRAVALTVRHGRRDVLAQYLRLAPYGNRIHGISYAARRYLGKPVEDLSWAEVAFLAALPQAPGRMNPYHAAGREAAVRRGRRVLDLLREGGALSAPEHELAAAQIDAIVVPPAPRRPAEAIHAVLRLAAQLREPALRGSLPEPPLVRTALDLELQEEVSWLAFETVRELRRDGAENAAVVVLDRAGTEVLAYAGSAGYFDQAGAGAIDYAAVPRPAGSTLKPFLYALALDRGVITPATLLRDGGRGPGGVENADLEFLGPLLPRQALANSRNVPAAELLGDVGLDEAWAFYRELGLHDGGSPARRWGTGLALGVLPVRLDDLTSAAAALAGDGLYREPRWLRGAPPAPPRRVLGETAARQVALFLSDPMARLPGFPRMGPSEHRFPAAVKTGTSAGCRDAWALAWSSRAIVGAWVGRPDFRPMKALGGYVAAAELARRVLALRHRDQLDGLDDLPFPAPRGHSLVRLCLGTGLLAGPACDRVGAEWLAPGQEPALLCNHPRALARAGAAPGAEPPALAGTEAPRLRVISPEPGTVLLADPEVPADAATIALEARAEPWRAQVVWYVDGRPWRVADYPFTARWPIATGKHSFQVRLPGEEGASAPVSISVH